MGLSGLEPPTSRLSGVRSNQLSYKPIVFFLLLLSKNSQKVRSVCPKADSLTFFVSGSHLLFHTVSSAVPSAAPGLTIVFGMGTGVSPERITTGSHYQAFDSLDNTLFCLIIITRMRSLIYPRIRSRSFSVDSSPPIQPACPIQPGKQASPTGCASHSVHSLLDN